jgi:hypothetical protein
LGKDKNKKTRRIVVKKLEPEDDGVTLKRIERILRSTLKDHEKVLAIKIVSFAEYRYSKIMQIIDQCHGHNRVEKLDDLCDEVIDFEVSTRSEII